MQSDRKKPTNNQFLEWKEHPVSQALFQFLQNDIEDEPAKLAEIGAALGFATDTDATMLKSQAAGVVARGFAYRELIDLDYEELFEGEEDE